MAVRLGDELDPEDPDAALAYCLSNDARALVERCAAKADAALDALRREFVDALGMKGPST